MYRLFLLLLIIGFFKIIKAQPEFDWANAINCTSEGKDIEIGVSEDTYTVGTFIGTGDLDPGTGVFNLTATNVWNGYHNYSSYLQKLDQSGSFVWAKFIPGIVEELVLDDQDNSYIIGSFEGTEDFDPGPNVNSLTSNGLYDYYVLKLDVNGNFLWVISLGGMGDDYGKSIGIDPTGNLLTTLSFSETLTVNTTFGNQTLVSNGGLDHCILKINSNGNIIWAKEVGGGFDDTGTSIISDQSGNVYCAGFYKGSIDFDPGSGVFNLSNSIGGIFIQKLNSNGSFLWAVSFEVGAWMDPIILMDGMGDIYLHDRFVGNADFDPDPSSTFYINSSGIYIYDLFILKLNQNSDFIWAKAISGSAAKQNGSMFIGNDDFIYLTSEAGGGTIDLDPGPAINSLNIANNRLFFILKLDLNGEYIWSIEFNHDDFIGLESIVGNSCNDLYLTGRFVETIDFDPEIGVHLVSATITPGCSNISSSFLLKLVNKHLRTDTIESCGPYTWIDGITYSEDNNTAEHEVQGMCDSLITLHLTITSDLAVDLGEDTLVCDGGQFMLDAFNNGASYVWSDNSSNATFNVSQSGTYYVEVSDGSCSVTDTIEVVYGTPPSEVDAGPDQLVCPGIYVTLNGAGAETYSWSHEVEDGVPFIPASADTYTLTGASIEGCTATDEVTVELREIEAKFSYSPVVIEITDPEVSFINQSINAISYQWTFGEGGESNEEHPIHTYAEPGIYPVQLIATSDAGCVDTALAHLEIRDLPYFFVPNSFTPNNDGVNDTFLPSLAGSLPSEYELLVYDKWGRVVFQSNDIYAAWDGTQKGVSCPVDTYVWVINMVGQYDVENTTERGHVNLIR